MNFIDLAAQRDQIRPQIEAAIARVLNTCGFIMGPEVTNFEKALATFAGAKHALACANGTDALLIPLRAWNIGPGDAVFVPSFTFVASAEVAPLVGASPVFVDVLPDTYNMDPASLEAAIESREERRQAQAARHHRRRSLRPARRLSRHLRHREETRPQADRRPGAGLRLHAQRQASRSNGPMSPPPPSSPPSRSAAMAMAARSSPTMIHSPASSTPSASTARRRAEDMAAKKYDNDPRYLNMRIGVNSRLDALQAAILSEKLKIYPDELQKRDAIAQRYNEGLAKHVRRVPTVIEGGFSNWAQYTIEHDNRDGLIAHLKTKGVPTAIYYPIPIHMQDVYAVYPTAPGGLPVTEDIRNRVMSLPMHPYLSDSRPGPGHRRHPRLQRLIVVLTTGATCAPLPPVGRG